MKNSPIAIVGAGTAGLAAATLLARQGWRVELLERVPQLQPVGAGILLQPSGLAVLRDLELLEECTGLGAPVSRLFGTSACGERVILDTRYQHWQPGCHGLGIHRGVLMSALLAAATGAGVLLRTGVAVRRFEQSPQGVSLFADDGQGGEAPCGDYAALILADGTRSRLRAQMQVRQWVKPYPWGALWSIVPTPEGGDSSDLRQWYRGCSQMFGIMPTGRTQQARQTLLSSLFWSLPTAAYPAWREAGLPAWKASVERLAGRQAEAFLAPIEAPEQLALATYADVRMQHWHDGRVLAIGDCAHAMSPQLGQGANMALVDAVALAAALRPAAASAASPDWAAVFTEYADARRRHLRYYRQASRLLTPLFQSDSATLAVLRDSALFLARHLPMGRQHAVTTLVGARTGWLFGRSAESSLHAWRGDEQVPAPLS
ncbi:FAD-dependent oxidoreductase [Phytopseudomonas dryadis]|uniref:FAD-binding monooxygenase n=1 Tax=Phytopseudomonas dryadis TaxID=2487520 RepID=A0ABY1Z5P7_9GAMM|nr:MULTISPECIES: NAD(P)/FAD-dependent oxidoreductase [Pseudomonas]TBV05396.1 FAD-binding monooxygenase [Pseudomonas dryadis]TBV18405.1 FAD-binding monooxygenase [Pseudomonas sp. FRB 230]